MDKQTLTLDTREYILFPMPPIKAAGFSARVAKLLAASLEDVAGLLSATADQSAALKAMSAGVAKLDTEEYTLLLTQALAYVSCEAGKLSSTAIMDDYFAKYPGDLHKVAVWAIWGHASPFLSTDLEDWGKVVPQV